MIADIDFVGIPPDDGYFLDIAKRKYSVVFKQDSCLLYTSDAADD